MLSSRGGGEFDGGLRDRLTRGGRRLLLTEPLHEHGGRPARHGDLRAHADPGRGQVALLRGNMLATRLAQERGFDEALLVTPHGRVLEAPTSSIFWVDARGRTSARRRSSEHILASITRQRVMAVVHVEERACILDDLRAAREAFLASTTREVQTIAAVDDIELSEGEHTREARRALGARIEEELES